MNEENKNLEAINAGNPTEANSAETIASLKEEVARLTEENQTLTTKVRSAESDRDFLQENVDRER